jgi:hypothetical protein
MKRFSRVTVALLGLCLFCASTTVVWAQTTSTDAATPAATPAAQAAPATPDINQRMQDLQKQVDDLKAALAAMQKPAPAPAEAPAAPAATAAVATPAPAAPAPITITSLLGPTTLSGFVDGYYGASFNHPATRFNGLRNFDIATNQFGLNMIELMVDKAPDAAASRLGYHVALGFGQAMNTVNAGEGHDASGAASFDQYLKEAYLSYLIKVGKGLQVDGGKFVTPAGAEVIESKDNWNYSRGLLFSWAIPYYHYGLRAKYTFSDKASVTGYLMNGWNNVIDNNSGKTIGLSIALTPNKKFGFTENLIAGPEGTNNNADWRELSDTVVTYNPNAKLSLMANADYGRGDRVPSTVAPFNNTTAYWAGIAGYVRYAFPKDMALSGRYEYYDDHNGFTTAVAPPIAPLGTEQKLQEFTGTFERIIASHLITRLEFRHDQSNLAVFQKGQGLAKSQNTITGGLILTFDTTGK